MYRTTHTIQQRIEQHRKPRRICTALNLHSTWRIINGFISGTKSARQVVVGGALAGIRGGGGISQGAEEGGRATYRTGVTNRGEGGGGIRPIVFRQHFHHVHWCIKSFFTVCSRFNTYRYEFRWRFKNKLYFCVWKNSNLGSKCNSTRM